MIDKIDEDKEKLLLQSAPYACADFNSYQLVGELARLVDENTEKVANIFINTLTKCTPSYKEEDIKHIIEEIHKRELFDILESINDHYLEQSIDFVPSYISSL